MDPFDTTPADSLAEARRAIEAIVLVATDPIPTQLLAQLLELPVELVGQLCDGLARDYAEAGRGFQLVEVGGGWRYQTHPDLAPYVERFALDGQSTRMSGAALETLAIVAYKQPISRAQVSAIRGVNVDGVLRTLVARGYVEEVGRDSGAGQAVLFGTTAYFLERVGLNALDQLPAIGDFVPSAQVVEALEQTLRVDVQNSPDGAPVDPVDPVDPADPIQPVDPFGPTDHSDQVGGPDDPDELDLRRFDGDRSLDVIAVHPAGTGDEPVGDPADLLGPLDLPGSPGALHEPGPNGSDPAGGRGDHARDDDQGRE